MNFEHVTERLKMAFAEAGYPDVPISFAEGAGGALHAVVPKDLPGHIVWRAGEVVGIGNGPVCFACYRRASAAPSEADALHLVDACEAGRRLAEDCGAPS